VDGETFAAKGLHSWPAPDVLLAACGALAVTPSHAAAFETLPAGVAAGHAAGFREVVAVERHGAAEAMRQNGADVVVRDLAELLDPALR
jgi:beta-phosphoglucomutase-like phosphatase (HAD superfamily)